MQLIAFNTPKHMSHNSPRVCQVIFIEKSQKFLVFLKSVSKKKNEVKDTNEIIEVQKVSFTSFFFLLTLFKNTRNF
jgi:CRISPR/Cas system type I-B associated protein Csh2 (Cas7 group RAMP superfamily)